MWIDLYPQDNTGDDSYLQFLCSSHHICMIDCCDEEYNFWPSYINLLPADKKRPDEEDVKKDLSKLFGSILHGIKNEKERQK